jgi:type I restriction enzyme S subunit
LFKKESFIKRLNSLIYGIRDGKQISYSEFSTLKLPYPEYNEQQKIAEFLESADSWIENLKDQKKSLEIYKKGMMQKIFAQEIRFKDENGKEFEEWNKIKLEEILYEHKDRNTENKYIEVFSVAKEKGVINQIEHLGRVFASNNLSNYKIMYDNDIAYTKSPTSNFPYGIIKQNLTKRIGLVSPLYAIFTPKNKYLGKLLHLYFLSWKNTYNYLNPLVQKGAKNTININNNDFLNGSRLLLPISEKEQQKNVDFLTSIDKLLESKQRQIVKAEEWKKGLMQGLFV